MTGGVADVAAGGGRVVGAVVVRVVLATVRCHRWCTGSWWWSCSWSVGRPRLVVLVLVVSMFAEAVGDVRLLALLGVVVALVSAGGAMGGGAAVSSRMSVTLMVGRRRCCFWVWVRVREVFGLLWALRAGFLLVLIIVFGPCRRWVAAPGGG